MYTLAKYNTGNIEKFLTDLEKNFIGADEWFHRFGTVHESSTNYPPYNLIKESSTEFTLEIALAGYKREDIEVSSEWNKLLWSVRKLLQNTNICIMELPVEHLRALGHYLMM